MNRGGLWVEQGAIADELVSGRLVSVLDDWATTYPPYYLYYSNRNISPALRLLAEFLKAG